MKTHSSKVAIVGLLTGFGTILNSHAVIFSDDFSVDHDYSALGVSGTGWTGIYNSGALGSPSQSSGGILTWIDNGVASHGWEYSDHSAPFLYVDATGDFSASVEMISAGTNTGSYSTGGLLVADLVGGAQDWIQATFSSWQSLNRVMNTDNNTTVEPTNQSMERFLRMDRVGNDFSLYAKANSGDAWHALGASMYRPDMPATLQIGVQFGKFQANSALMNYDNFAIVPEPTSALLAATGVGIVALRRRRSS